MPSQNRRASRLRYQDYRAKLQQRRQRGELGIGDAAIHKPLQNPAEIRKQKPRSRSFLRLLAEFWKMLASFRGLLIAVLAAVSVSTLIGLVPLYGTRIIFDSVLRDPPLPPQVPHFISLPHRPHLLLTTVAATMVVLAIIS
ncbi:MAG TPA: hypothetical protein VHZ30_01985, partial [Verrucomicrobiae bacterium]|nr:hypothetical protein [Verrucomicrobiae bacterium]